MTITFLMVIPLDYASNWRAFDLVSFRLILAVRVKYRIVNQESKAILGQFLGSSAEAKVATESSCP
jgi:hypothetical protein